MTPGQDFDESSTASGSYSTPRSGSSGGARPPLPDKSVSDAVALEDAYVNFIFYCNPGVPTHVDTAALREAFRLPPKSGGKTFSTFTLFELIKQLDAKVLRTWAELAVKLGVEPPVVSNGESFQKIQQYAARLKRWMHSLHIDAYFDYLVGRPHAYWTTVPSDTTANAIRDGVAAEDDMTLRALLPHIRPKRGRKKPREDETSCSPPARPSPTATEMPEPWSALAQPDARHDARHGALMLPGPPGETVQTSFSYCPYPQSADTPTTRQLFWSDEPQSAMTPAKSKHVAKRHGAKVVSSAWRSGRADGTGKTRGRPPTTRGPNEDALSSAFPAAQPPDFRMPSPRGLGTDGSHGPNQSYPAALATHDAHGLRHTPAHMHTHTHTHAHARTPAHTHTHTLPQAAGLPTRTQSHNPGIVHERPAKRNRLSLHVPPREGGRVRLATPPTLPASAPVDYEEAPCTDSSEVFPPEDSDDFVRPTPSPMPFIAPPSASSLSQHSGVRFQDPDDRTNLAETEAYFMHHILSGEWYNLNGDRIPACGFDEAWAITDALLQTLRTVAVSKEAFLINLAALAGGRLLMGNGPIRVTRVAELAESTRYSCHWELRLGDIRSTYCMYETVLHERWRRPAAASADDGPSTTGPDPIEAWQKRYGEMVELLRKKEDELESLKAQVLACFRKPPRR